MKISTSFLLLFSILICITNGEDEPLREGSYLSHLTNQQIDSLLQSVSSRNLTITERMSFYSRLFLGTPYDFRCVGDGPYALYENYPLVNFQETNCMAYCEHVLALAISDSWDNFFNNLQQIRYYRGLIGMRTRNHYTVADWLPENGWLLYDATREVGTVYVQKMTRVISHRNFFLDKGIKDLRYIKPDRQVSIYYLPSDRIETVKANFRNGDILALLFARKKDIFSAHMLMVYREKGLLLIRESSNSRMTTFETPFELWLQKIVNNKRYAGIIVMRVHEELNQPGLIILPWEVEKYRERFTSSRSDPFQSTNKED